MSLLLSWRNASVTVCHGPGVAASGPGELKSKEYFRGDTTNIRRFGLKRG